VDQIVVAGFQSFHAAPDIENFFDNLVVDEQHATSACGFDDASISQ
jgi:hypothetical protein